MIHSVNALYGSDILARDGEIGAVKDVYFDDDGWAVRYLVVDTGPWILGRKVLISPYSIHATRWDSKTIAVSLSRQQVKESPDIDTDKPVSRRLEASYLGYYSYPVYWGGPMLWGGRRYPLVSPAAASPEDAFARAERQRDLQKRATNATRLRSSREVRGYQVRTIDGPVGQLDDFLFDEHSWAIGYAAVDTRDFWPGKRTIVPTRWIASVQWREREVCITARRDVVKESPEYDPSTPMSEAYERNVQRRFAQRGVRA